ncbi:MAG: hypothetical protein JO000_18595 [Alphaproteobacteria bacterium]|nr:hypothetical protein [Alphaproteobacteria bacterium]
MLQVLVKTPSSDVKDSAKVRLGAISPAMPATRPAPAATADSAKVRLGAISPALPKTR